MNYRTKIKSNHEIIHPIIIWIIASILFHLILALGIITLKITSVPLRHQQKTAQDRAILMMDEPKKSTSLPTMPTAAKKAEEKIDIKKQENNIHKPSDYTLIPGRQGINQQNLNDLTNFQDLPKPQDQTLAKKAQMPKILKSEQKDNITEANIQAKEQGNPKKNPVALPTTKQESLHHQREAFTKKVKDFSIAASQIKILNDIGNVTKFTNQSLKNSSKKIPHQGTDQQDPYQFVPQPSRIISFKELNLGFDNNYATIGNNANLIQQGITTAAPDDMSLKHLTYYNQCAGMMKAAFATHPQTRLRQNATGKRFRFDLTVDRQGNQIKLTVLHGSGDMILDRIIQESIESVKMFPKVPSFIPDSPFLMRWTFLH